MFDTILSAINDLKKGKCIIICDDEDRENEGDLVALGEMITPQTVNFMITHGRGLLCVPITEKIANRLSIHQMVYSNTDTFKTAFTVSIDHISSTTGISAFERSNTIQQLANPYAQAIDFKRPGHLFPLIAKPHGVMQRAGHTEAAIDLCNICGVAPVGVLCEILNEDGTMARREALLKQAKKWDLKMITIKDLIYYRKCHEQFIKREIEVHLPTEFGNFLSFGYSHLIESTEYIALVKGSFDPSHPTLVRIHSECLTGDVFHSLRCDCGHQLSDSLKMIEANKNGVFIFLRQEGRGIGLINKLKAYKLQQNGFDTCEANLSLGFEEDNRDYYIAAQILKDLNIYHVELITNNPLKVSSLEKYGIVVTKRIDASTHITNQNKDYIEVKKKKLNHLYTVKK